MEGRLSNSALLRLIGLKEPIQKCSTRKVSAIELVSTLKETKLESLITKELLEKLNKIKESSEYANILKGSRLGLSAYQKPSSGIPLSDLSKDLKALLVEAEKLIKDGSSMSLPSIFNPNNYYNKVQVDNYIANAIANINLTNYYTKLEVDEKVGTKANIMEAMGKSEYLGLDGNLKGEYAAQMVLYYMGDPYDEGITTRPQPYQLIYDNGYISYTTGSQVITLGQPQSHIVYCNAKTNKLYRWDGSEFVMVGGLDNGGMQATYSNGTITITGSGPSLPSFLNGTITL